MATNRFKNYARSIIIAAVALGYARPSLGGSATLTRAVPITPGPFCGIHSLYAAMRYDGGGVRFASLLSPKYVHGANGSSFGDLKRAAEANGFHAVPVQNLTGGFLRNTRWPIILHVKSSERSREPDHFIPFLRWVPDGARIYDAPNPIKTVSFQQLSARWDGTGLLISRDPVSDIAVFRPSWMSSFFAGTIALVIAIALALVPGWTRFAIAGAPAGGFHGNRIKSSLACQTALLVMFAVLAAAAYRVAALRTGSSLIDLPGAASGASIPIVDYQRLRGIISGDQVLIVDARDAGSYASGHIPGAINVPVDVPRAELRRSLQRISLTQPIVVYCQSSACTFSDIVAEALRSSGYKNVSVFRGGWTEWERHGLAGQ